MFERFHRDARVAVVLAQEEARDLGADRIMPAHLLLGVLTSGRSDALAGLLATHGVTPQTVRASLTAVGAPLTDDDAAALRALGIDVDQIRDRLTAAFGPDAWNRPDHTVIRGGHIAFARSAKKALELALREAFAHKDNWIGSEHLVLGLLRGGDEVTVGLLTARVDARRLRAEVLTLLEGAA